MWFSSSGEKVGVVVIGCGEPKRCMGWYHAKQLLADRVPGAELTDIVEPFLLGPGKDTEGGKAFAAWAGGFPNVNFHSSVDAMPSPVGKKLVLIAGRTSSNPQFFKQAIDHGFTNIYLEKPGAGTLEELEAMSAQAKANGVTVCMGYNKNVAKYAQDVLVYDATNQGGVIGFEHGNSYKPDQLEDCFARGQEGMLKNMMIHELTLVATYFGVTVKTLAALEPDLEFSRWETHGKYSDFARLAFTLTTVDGRKFVLKGNRCTENFSWATVAMNGKEAFRARMPDPGLEAKIEELKQADPGLIEYFYVQDSEYLDLKQRFCAHILDEKPGTPEGLATIDVGIEALKLAEFLQPSLVSALRSAPKKEVGCCPCFAMMPQKKTPPKIEWQPSAVYRPLKEASSEPLSPSSEKFFGA
mmetsp:Transcript_143188/g.249723  ORF Transcript_143188/g.249723 Transcript_143188/m.249723 type:complete len:412 (+) Transcript_143188:62-1297(+)